MSAFTYVVETTVLPTVLDDINELFEDGREFVRQGVELSDCGCDECEYLNKALVVYLSVAERMDNVRRAAFFGR